MPAVSKSQQRLMAMVHAYKNGKLKKAPKKIKDVARHISDSDARDFARTKHKGLPAKKASFLDEMFVRGFMSRLREFAGEYLLRTPSDGPDPSHGTRQSPPVHIRSDPPSVRRLPSSTMSP